MNKLITLFLAALGLIVNPVDVVGDTSTIPNYIYNAAVSFQIDPSLMYAICNVESNCRHKAINHDDGTPRQKAAGIVDKSYGLFQIKPATAKALGFVLKEEVTVEKVRKGRVVKVKKTVDHTKDLLQPEINAWYAAKLLRHLYDRHDDTIKVISAYNAGRYTSKNKDYVYKVLKHYIRYTIDKRR